MIGDLINLLNYFGITADRLVPLGILAVIGAVYLNRRLSSEIGPLRGSVEKIKYNLGMIVANLKGDFDTGLLQSYSPVRLTPLGERLLRASGARRFIDEYAAKLEMLMDEDLPTSALDVQSFAYTIMARQFEENQATKPIKDYLYQHPSYTTDNGRVNQLSAADMLSMMAVYFRDLYLAKHANLQPHSEIGAQSNANGPDGGLTGVQ